MLLDHNLHFSDVFIQRVFRSVLFTLKRAINVCSLSRNLSKDDARILSKVFFPASCEKFIVKRKGAIRYPCTILKNFLISFLNKFKVI